MDHDHEKKAVTADAKEADDHLVPLPGSQWAVWRDAVLRSTGFPADGLDRFAAPECAAVADACLSGRSSRQEFESAYAAACADAAVTAAAIAADPLFREALTWQNPVAASVLAALPREAGHRDAGLRDARHQRKKWRKRADVVARYWQRYCGKNDTIGFFGPVSWATIDPRGPAVTLRRGPGLVRSREVCYEYWALEAYVRRIAADPVVRPWLPVGIHPHLTLEAPNRQVLRPGQPPLPLSDAEVEVLARCDGRRPAADIAAAAVSADVGLAGDTDVFDVLGALCAKQVVWWGVDLPLNPRADGVLRATLAGVGDPAARERALAGLRRLDTARAAVAAASGDPDALITALGELDAEFVAVTGADPQRRKGEAYAGRRVCYEETVRDVDVTFGSAILDAIADPLTTVLLPAARWLSAALADAYTIAFRQLYDTLIQPGADGVPLGSFWQPAWELARGRGPRPVDAVAAEFRRRWTALLGLEKLPPGVHRVSARAADMAKDAARVFEAAGPGWAGARIHSPDLHICAASVQALARGEFTVVLGEIHTAWPTLDNAVFVDRHPDPDRLRAAAARDIGPQIRPLYPTDWPRYTARIAPVLGVTDHQLAFAPAPGADPARVLPITALTVADSDGQLVAVGTDGSMRPLAAVFALLIGWLAAAAFDLTGGAAHSSRITVDRLVIARETWRTTIGDAGLADAGTRPEQYLAARRLRAALGLPERVFARIATEIKPVYVDFTSPRYLSAFCTMLRSAAMTAGEKAAVAFSELLPTPEDAWLTDATGRRYFSELRIQVRDPMRARPVPAAPRKPTGPAQAGRAGPATP